MSETWWKIAIRIATVWTTTVVMSGAFVAVALGVFVFVSPGDAGMELLYGAVAVSIGLAALAFGGAAVVDRQRFGASHEELVRAGFWISQGSLLFLASIIFRFALLGVERWGGRSLSDLGFAVVERMLLATISFVGYEPGALTVEWGLFRMVATMWAILADRERVPHDGAHSP